MWAASIPDGLRDARLAWSAAYRDGVRSIPQAAPILGYHNAVDRTVGIVANRAGKAEVAVVDVHIRAQIRYILRALVAHACDRVLVEDQLHAIGTAALVRAEVGDVDNGSVNNAPRLHQLLAPKQFQLFVGGALSGCRIGNDAPDAETDRRDGSPNCGVAQGKVAHRALRRLGYLKDIPPAPGRAARSKEISTRRNEIVTKMGSSRKINAPAPHDPTALHRPPRHRCFGETPSVLHPEPARDEDRHTSG